MMRTVLLSDICSYVNSKIQVEQVQLTDYVSTENLLQNKGGLSVANKLPSGKVTVFQAGDVLVSNIRPYFKKIWLANRSGGASNDVLVFRKLNDNVYEKYLYYILADDRFFAFSTASASGSKMPRGDKTQIMNYPVNLPPLDQQKKIADILGSLDEKIELNRRMNEALEQLGQALFRHYFVDNPEANSWDDVKVGELVDIKGGGTPSTKNSSFWGGDIVWSSPRDLANQKCHFLMRTDKTITKQGLSKISSGVLPAGTLLLSSRAPIGYIAFTGVDMAINQGYIAFLPKAKLSNYFMYFWLKNNIQKIKDSANGSTFLEISKTAFRNIYIKQPNQLLHNKFQYKAMIILDKIRNNEAEIYNLTSLRDSLLPKLISGEVIL
mgnify:CR=1 FL=1